MKVNIIGGGPAGLYLSILLKKTNPSCEIDVFERNGPLDTFGWGVVFSGRTLANLRQADAESHHEITQNFQAWNNVDVVHRNEKVSIHGNSFSGIARILLLNILQRRAEQLGVRLHFHAEIADVRDLQGTADILVAADGVNSTVRRLYEKEFKPVLDTRPNRYIWYGTNQLFHGLTLTFRQNDAGVFAAHSYKFDETTSTFIVECDPETWSNAGLDSLDDAKTSDYLTEVFKQDLHTQPLLSNNSKWIQFLLVKNENWFFENVILLGDALHTAHFSIGSGTKLAIEDAIALATSLNESGTIADALATFEASRRPVIEDYQAAAFESMTWFENAPQYMHLSPIELAFSLMMRSGRVSYDDLKQRDPEFIQKYEERES